MSTARHLYELLAEDLTGLIAKGTLRPGDRLPSVRLLSDQRGVSISTVLQAYLLLESRGHVETRPQSGHYVRAARLALVPEPRAPRAAGPATRVSVSELVKRVYGAAREPDMVLLGAGYMSTALLPADRLCRGLANIARSAGGAALAYDPPPGLPALRRQIARRAAECGVTLGADEIVTTVGTMEALHLCLRAVAKAGDTIAVESPAYYGILQLVESLGMRVLEIPSNPGTGVDLSLLDKALRQHRIKACLVVTNFSNPLGALMPDEAKRELYRMLARREIPLVEDDIYGDLHFEGARPRPARAFDRQGLVMLCSSFSKTLAPGFRVGYVAPGRFRDAVERLKFAQTVASPTITQMAIAEFLENGGYERHLRRLRRALADQVARVSDAIALHFPPGTRISRPRGGFFLWVEMPAGKSALELHERAALRGVSVDNQEVSDVIGALTLLESRAPADLDALDGVNLSRVSSIAGGWAGLTTVKPDGQAIVQLSDKIFENNAVQFFGGDAPDSPARPATFEPILHEIGHLVEKKSERAARLDVTQAGENVEGAKKNREEHSASYNEKVAKTKNKKLHDKLVAEQAKAYHADEQAEDAARDRQGAAGNALKSTMDTHTDTQPDGKAAQRTQRLQSFARLVGSEQNDAKGIPITAYASTSVEESYAEAYSLWLVDRQFLKRFYPTIYDFFQSGKHREPPHPSPTSHPQSHP